MALMHPERVERVISLNTPFMPRGRTRPLETIGREPDDRFNYVAYFQKPGQAEADIEPNIDTWIVETLRSVAKNQSFITEDTVKVFADAFRKGGITGPLNYYRNIDRNWETTADLEGRKVTMPALMICAENDPVLLPEMTDGMENHVLNLTKHVVRDCGHWTQQEWPDEVNRLIIEFVEK